MQTGRPKADLVLSEQARSQLQLFARSRSLLAALCSRARIVLSSAEGEPNNSIAERLRLTKATVGKWRTRFIERRIASLCDDVRPGAPRTIDDERVAQLIKTTLHTKPESGSTHWSVRSVAAETGISKTSVLHPHLQLLAEPGREILCVDHRQGHPTRIVHQRQATRAAHLTCQVSYTHGAHPKQPCVPVHLRGFEAANLEHQDQAQSLRAVSQAAHQRIAHRLCRVAAASGCCVTSVTNRNQSRVRPLTLDSLNSSTANHCSC